MTASGFFAGWDGGETDWIDGLAPGRSDRVGTIGTRIWVAVGMLERLCIWNVAVCQQQMGCQNNRRNKEKIRRGCRDACDRAQVHGKPQASYSALAPALHRTLP